MQHQLERIMNGEGVPDDLTIVYNDVHGLWGGIEMTVRKPALSATATGERRELTKGVLQPEHCEVTISPTRLRDLVDLLIRHKIWEQKTPERMPVPDESRATLTIRVGEESSRVWERVNEMERNQRLSLIKEKMEELIAAR